MSEIIPNGWVKVKTGDFLKLKNGYAFKSKDYTNEGVPVIRISDIKGENVTTEKSVNIPEELYKENFLVEEGDVLIAMSGATTGKYGIYKDKNLAVQNQRVGNLRPLQEDISKKFLFYLYGGIKSQVEDVAYGAAQPNISSKLVEDIDVMLPPLAEQKRIVAKLDALFEHLEVLKTKLDRIPELLKNFRQSVLTQAVTGKLTEEWREGKGLDEWEETKIGNIFDVKTGATPKRGNKKYYENGVIPWVKSGLVVNDFINEVDEFITQEAITETNAKLFPVDTLLVAMYGEGKTRGQVGWLKIEAATNQAIAALVNETLNDVTRLFVFYFCLSQYVEIRALAEGGNQPNLNLSKIKNWELKLPPFGEQKEIVKKVDELFSSADSIESQYKSVKEKIDHLPQAILQKAFKGELVPQDPNDEPASVLLERIQGEKGGKE